MQMLVKTPEGSTITLEMENSDTLDDIKEKVRKKIRIPIDEQRLLFGGKQLYDGVVLDQINLIQSRLFNSHNFVGIEPPLGFSDWGNAHPTIILALRLRGGANVITHNGHFQRSPFDGDESPQMSLRVMFHKVSPGSQT